MKNNKDSFKVPTKNTPGGALSAFWRIILDRTNRTEKRVSLITDAIFEEKLRSNMTDKDANGLKHRIKKQCDDGEMTWRTIVTLCCKVLKVQNLKITFQFELDGKEYIVSKDVNVTNDASLNIKDKEKE